MIDRSSIPPSLLPLIEGDPTTSMEIAKAIIGHKISVDYKLLGEIAAEKVVALLDAARNEPRDLYDIWFLTCHGHIDLRDWTHAMEKKWEFRGKKPPDARQALESKEARYRKLWDLRLGAQMAELPAFAEVFRLVRRALRDAGIIGN